MERKRITWQISKEKKRYLFNGKRTLNKKKTHFRVYFIDYNIIYISGTIFSRKMSQLTSYNIFIGYTYS